jgi:hypothetical protein
MINYWLVQLETKKYVVQQKKESFVPSIYKLAQKKFKKFKMIRLGWPSSIGK